jgi:hypothetical protein
MVSVSTLVAPPMVAAAAYMLLIAWSAYTIELERFHHLQQEHAYLRASALCTDPVARLASASVNNCEAADRAAHAAHPRVHALSAALRRTLMCPSDVRDCYALSTALNDVATHVIVSVLSVVLLFAWLLWHKASSERRLASLTPLPSAGTPAGWPATQPLYVKAPGDAATEAWSK